MLHAGRSFNLPTRMFQRRSHGAKSTMPSRLYGQGSPNPHLEAMAMTRLKAKRRGAQLHIWAMSPHRHRRVTASYAHLVSRRRCKPSFAQACERPFLGRSRFVEHAATGGSCFQQRQHPCLVCSNLKVTSGRQLARTRSHSLIAAL